MNTRFMLSIVLTGILAGWSYAAPAENSSDYAAVLEKLLPGMGAEKIPARKDSQLELEKLCHEAAAPGKESQRAALAKAIMAKTGPETAKPARVWMLRKIETLGLDEVVPGLTEILKDSDAEIVDLARRALANNPTPAAAAALRDALAAAKDADSQVALINSLGWRRDTESVGAIAKLAAGQDAAVGRAAAEALGDIADSGSTKALAELRKSAQPEVLSTVIDASLRVADNLRKQGENDTAAAIYEELMKGSQPEYIRVAAITGLAAAKGPDAAPALLKYVNGDDAHLGLIAARCLQRMDKQVTPGMVAAMESASPQARALLLEALGEHGDITALKAVAEQAAADDADVRIAALGAIGKLGDSSMVPLLIERGIKSKDAERDAAHSAMASLHGKDVDGLILERLAKSDGSEKVELIYAVWGRRIAAGRPTMLETARSKDAAARVAALMALERLAKPEDLNALVDVLADDDSAATRKLAEEAISSVCRRAGDSNRCVEILAAAMEKAPAAGKIALIHLLTDQQNEAGLSAIRTAARSDDASVKQAAAAALKQWKPMQITSWAFSGPYRQEGKGPEELFEIAFPPENSSGSAQWKPIKINRRDAQNAPIDLLKLAKGDNCCGYCRAMIRSERAQAIVLTFGSDDGIKVWLNGEVIHSKNVVRSNNCDDDKVKATLKAGENTLMVKVTQGGADWSFCCRIGSAEGGPPDSVSFNTK